ncbi:MAG: PAS domain S-box protein [Pseudomonadota bacterium]
MTNKKSDKSNDTLQKELSGLRLELETFKTFKKQLRSKLDFFNLLFETLANPIFIKNKDGIYLSCNTAFETFMGMKRTDIIGKTVYDMGPKEIADKYYEMDRQLFEQGGIQKYEWKIKIKNGQEKTVIFDKALFHNEDNTIGGLIGVITDITHRIDAEKAIKNSQEKFKKISELANDAIIQMNDKGRIIFWNAAAEKIFGYPWEEVNGKDLHQLLVPSRYLTPFNKSFQQFKLNGKGAVIGKTIELSALRKDGSEFEVELSLSAYQEDDHWHSVGIVRDISRRKQNERERDQLILNLTKALDEIKTLRGIVPICASCKKIRDDQGFWKHVETYVQEHSHAQFSHGICPDCQKKLYPEFSKPSK